MALVSIIAGSTLGFFSGLLTLFFGFGLWNAVLVYFTVAAFLSLALILAETMRQKLSGLQESLSNVSVETAPARNINGR